MESTDKVVETVIVGNYVEMESEGKPNNNNDIKSKFSNLFWHGGSAYDAWFSCASNQVAQVLLTLPYSFSQLGMLSGVSFQLFYGLLGSWTAYLISILYIEYRTRKEREKVDFRNHVIQWFEVLDGLLGKHWRNVGLAFNCTFLLFGSVIQLIACASNIYYINNNLDKRTWTYIFGACCATTVFIPSFHNYRIWSFLGLLMTTYTAWYLTVASLLHGQVEGVKHSGPTKMVLYFTGATNILYTFGGHAVTVEIMHAMWKPQKFKAIYLWATLYVLTLTLPSAASVYWAFGDLLLDHSNAFSLLPKSPFRDMAVILMLIHQFITFGFACTPLYFVWEKAIGMHECKSMCKRAAARLPVVIPIWFLAIVFPFFGPINSSVGSLLVSFTVYIIPALAYMFTFKSAAARENAVEQPPKFVGRWAGSFTINIFVVVWVLIVGFGFGGWASMTNFIHQIDTFGLFTKCYQCPPPPGSPRHAIRKARPQSAERVLAKETRLHLAQKELNKLKDQLKNAETTRAQALTELERAKRTVDDLTKKLKIVCESKDLAVKATEAAKSQVNQLEEPNDGSVMGKDGSWKVDLETAREKYMAEIADLDKAKQELRKIRQDCNTFMEEKAGAIEQAAEAERTAKANMERASELSKEIAVVHESVDQLKLACVQEREEEAKIYAEKDVQKQSYKAKLEESAEKLLALKKETDADLAKSLEAQLAETMSQIEALRKEMDSAKSSDLDKVKVVTAELDDAKESLRKVAEEESTLQTLVETLKLDLENIKKEHSDLKEKEAETESLAGGLHVKLRKAKSELEIAVAEEARERGASEEMISTLHQLILETENAKLEAEEMKMQAEELKKEAEAARMALEDAEKKLKVAMEEAEEAKSAEAEARDQIKILSEKTTAARSSTSESGARITLSRDEFDSLSRKVEELDNLAEIRVGAAMAQVEAVKASENEALKKLESTQKEIDDIKTATQEALKKAEMAEAAKKAVEGELRRWREREQKKAAEAASRILAETHMNYRSSPQSYTVQKEKPSEKFMESHVKMHSPVETKKQNTQDNIMEMRKLQKAKTSVSKKKVLMPSISGIFHKKKNQVEGDSPSYLPGEKPVW